MPARRCANGAGTLNLRCRFFAPGVGAGGAWYNREAQSNLNRTKAHMETYSQNPVYSRGSAANLGGARRPVSYGQTESRPQPGTQTRTQTHARDRSQPLIQIRSRGRSQESEADKTPAPKTQFMRYASDGPVVQAIYRYTTGPFRKWVVLAAVAIVLACLYAPVRDLYVARRSGEVLKQQVAICKKYNKTLKTDIEALLSEEGVKDVANKRLGLVTSGEKKLNVIDGSSESDTASGETIESSDDLERELAAVVTDVPWYTSALDTVFGFTGIEGQTSASSS